MCVCAHCLQGNKVPNTEMGYPGGVFDPLGEYMVPQLGLWRSPVAIKGTGQRT